MILDILVFVLGVLVSGLLALSALPSIWRRALRLSSERLSRLVPLSADEIAAERDHLRAAHAVELRRTEQRLEAAEAARATLRVEAARRENHILDLDGEAARAQVTIASLEAETAAQRREADALRAENGAEAIALHGLTGLAENRLFAIAALQRERAALQAEQATLRGQRDAFAERVDHDRGSMAGLETRLLGADTRNEDLRRELEHARRDVTAAAERIAAAAKPADATSTPQPDDPRTLLHTPPHDIESLTAELAFMAEQAASAERRATEATKAYEALAAERDVTAEALGAPSPAVDETLRLRAAIAALAEDVLRLGGAG